MGHPVEAGIRRVLVGLLDQGGHNLDAVAAEAAHTGALQISVVSARLMGIDSQVEAAAAAAEEHIDQLVVPQSGSPVAEKREGLVNGFGLVPVVAGGSENCLAIDTAVAVAADGAGPVVVAAEVVAGEQTG